MKVNLGNPNRKNHANKIQIDDWDTWSLDVTLASIAVPALKKFKVSRKRVPGVPMAFFKEGAEVDENGNHTDKALKEAEKAYIDAIDQMIWSLTEVANGNKGENKFFKIVRRKVKGKTTVGSNGKHSADTYNFDFDKKGLEEYRKRVQTGLELFGKHFTTLWW